MISLYRNRKSELVLSLAIHSNSMVGLQFPTLGRSLLERQRRWKVRKDSGFRGLRRDVRFALR
jgi:hypothetical protein